MSQDEIVTGHIGLSARARPRRVPRAPGMVRTWFVLSLAFAMVAGGIVFPSVGPLEVTDASRASWPGHVHPPRLAGPGRLDIQFPQFFEANRGQTDPEVKFLSRGGDYVFFLTSTEAVLALTAPTAPRQAAGQRREGSPSRPAARPQTVLRMKFADANPTPRITGQDEYPSKAHYFIGNDPAQWRPNIPMYARVHYAGLYPGVDLRFYGDQRKLEYDFVVHPGADPSKIGLDFQGAETLAVTRQGDLALQMRAGIIWQLKPVVYQEVAGVRREIAGRFVRKSSHHIGFQVGAYDRHQPLVIDPVVASSTYLGGSSNDAAFGIAVDGSGNVYVTGGTNSADFPTTAGAYRTTSVSYDVFVTKYDPSGALAYSTFLGGSSNEEGYAIAVDGSGNAYVTGATQSTNFPTTVGALQTTYGGGYADAFVTKLNPSGSGLVYSTYLGGSGDEDACVSCVGGNGGGIAVDGAGNAYVAGYTSSTNFPTTPGAYQMTSPGGYKAFVVKFGPSGSRISSTYLGGSGDDQAFGIAVDGLGNVYVTGGTTSLNFPTTMGSYQTTSKGGFKAFVTKFGPSGAPAYSTYLGGSGNEISYGIAIDGTGNAYVTGATLSTDFPTTPGAYQTAFGGSIDAFVTKVNPSGTGLMYSTYLGGSIDDWALGIAVDSVGNTYVTGYTSSPNFPVANAFQPTYGGGLHDAFVTALNPSGTGLVFSSFLGGSGEDQGHDIAVDGSGTIYVTGYTNSSDFPTTPNGHQVFPGGVSVTANVLDAFVTTITPATAPPPAPTATITANPTSIPTGQSSTLTWSSQNATSATLDGAVVGTSGNTTVSPTATTTYTLVALGAGGQAMAQATVTVTPTPPAPTATITANPTSIPAGQSSTLTWSSQNATSATLDGAVVGTSGTTTVSPTATTTYTLVALGAGGQAMAQATVTVLPLPTATITANPTTIPAGQSSTLTWSSQNATSATLDGAVVGTSGSTMVSPTATTTYTLVVLGAGGQATAQATVTVPPLPTATITANPTSIPAGQSSTLTWSSQNATSATLNGVVVGTSGSRTVSPTATTTYTLVVLGAGGQATAQATVTVLPAATATISANPTTIPAGQSSTLTWSTQNAISATLNGAAVPTSGTRTVSPTATTTYTIVAVPSSGLQAWAEVTVTVPPRPTATFSAGPTTIQAGRSSTLTWSSQNATSATLSGTAVATSGSTTVSPTATTTYTLVVSGPGGQATKQATVTVLPVPTATISANPTSTLAGQPVTLTWSSQNGTSATLNGTLVPMNATRTVFLQVTTTYTLVVSGPGGQGTATVTVTVL